MDAVSTVPPPANEPVRAYAPGSAERAAVESKIKELAASPAELTMTIGGQQRMGGAERIAVVAAAQPRARPRPPRQRHRGRRGRGHRRGRRGGAGLAGDVLRRPGGDLPQGRRPAGRPVALHDQRGDDPGPVQVGVPGRDRRRLRADRLLAVQRALRPAAAGRAAGVGGRRVGPDGVPPARGVRAGHHAVQLHLDRREPADRAGPDGQRRAVETVADRSSYRRTTRCGCWRRPGCRPA